MNDRFTDIEQIPIEQIEVGQRRRKKFGNLRELAASIATHGLLHPIIIRGNVLVSGHRRLEACKLLKWALIPVRRAERMNDEELRAVELEENTQRLELDGHERSEQRMAQIRLAEAGLKAKAEKKAETAAEEEELSRPSGEKKKSRGRPKGSKKPTSRAAIAKTTGISDAEQRRIERHVDLGNRYPFMKRDGWVKNHVLQAGDGLEKLPEEDRDKLAAMLDQPGVPPKSAIQIIINMQEKSAREREEIFIQAESGDELTRRTALTRANNTPAPLDPAHNLLMDARRNLKKAIQVAHSDEARKIVVSAHEFVVTADEQLTILYKEQSQWQ